MRRGLIGALLAVAAVAAVVQGIGHTGHRPVAWRDVSKSATGLDRSVAAFSVVKGGGRERILISPGPRSSTGYAVEIVRVVEQRRRILVDVRERTPRLGQRVEARVTYPYKLIEIPRTRKHVTIHWLGH